MTHFVLLAGRIVISLEGPDARGFLQGLITSDMETCRDGTAIYAALLTPQGKILYDFFVAEGGSERFLIDCAAERKDELVKRLTLYRLRSKVEISETGLAVAAYWNGAPPSLPEDAIAFADPRLVALGRRVIAPKEALEPRASTDTQAYRLHCLGLGVPDSADMPPDTVFALDAGLEELHGVSFSKGCFIGQEVTARMKHRASARRRFLVAQTDAPLPPPGTPVEAGGKAIGTFATGTGDTALALIRLDRLAEAEAAGAPVTAAGKSVILRKPDWLGI